MIVHMALGNKLMRAILPTIAVWALLGLGTGCFAQAEEQEEWAEEITGADIGKDVHAFKTAALMYEIAPTKPYDRRAADLIDAVTRKLGSKKTLESRDVWRGLLELNPYRKSAEVQAVVPTWADISAQYVRNSTGGSLEAAKKWFEQANLDYNAKSFPKASRNYGEALRLFPAHLDARNNLALAQLHLGNDLTAQVELETMTRLYEDYVPALINLTVVYERLDLRDEAAELAREAAQKREDVPAAVYNHAWYANLDGNLNEASNLLKPLVALDVNPKHAELYDLTQRQIAAMSFWHRGLARTYGGDQTSKARLISLAVFIVLTAIMMFVCTRLGAGANSGGAAFWAFAFVGGFCYILFWGLPGGMWWVLMAAYALVLGGVCASGAERN